MKPALIRGYDNRIALGELWGQAFGDDSDFIAKMYDCGYLNPSDIFVLTVDGRPVSALFLPEYRICLGESDFPIRLLSCVATDPSAQGKGYMSYLISRSLELVRDCCCGVCVIPVSDSLFSFYRKLGFETKFFCSQQVFDACEAAPSKILPPAPMEQLYSAYLEKYRKDGCVYKTWDRFLQAVEEYSHPSQPSEFFVSGRDFAFAQRESSRVLVREWVGDPQTLAEQLSARYGLPVCFQNVPGEEPFPMGMFYAFSALTVDDSQWYLNCMYN